MTAHIVKPSDPVLLIEDNVDVRDMLSLMLVRGGYGVVSAANGREALDLLQTGLVPCLIVLDYHMPVMNGREFRLTQLRSALQAHVPVVLYSADITMDPADLQVAVAYRRPISPTEFIGVVDHWSVAGSA